MRHLPTGTVTFLFSDIEGSTATSSDLTTTLWDLQSQKRLGSSFPVRQEALPVARFTPKGDLLIDYLADAAQWPTDLRTWKRFACRVAGRDLTRDEWADLLPGRPFRGVCRGL